MCVAGGVFMWGLIQAEQDHCEYDGGRGYPTAPQTNHHRGPWTQKIIVPMPHRPVDWGPYRA